MSRLLITSLSLSLAVGSVHAVVLPNEVQAALNQRYSEFVSEEGFSNVEPDGLLERYYTPARFPDRDTNSVFAEDAGINAATKALMLLESQEDPLPHVRYRITYRLDDAPDFSGYPSAYVEVTRFNLGPIRHADVLESTIEGVPVAPAAHFGEGPSVSWRFVMVTIQGGVENVVDASRRVMSPTDAQKMDCLGAPCVALKGPQGPEGEWQPTEPPSAEPAAYVAQINGVATAARISELLYLQASDGQRQVEALPTHAPESQLTFVISMGVEGHDYSADGLMHHQFLFDDAISDIWTRRQDAGPETVEWQQHFQYHPGRS